MVKVILIDQMSFYHKAFAKLMSKVDNVSLVGVAENGLDAIKMIQKYHPQIVFCELLLGSENGIDVCKAIKNTYPDISVNILSTYRNMNLMNKAIQSGIDSYLLKPISEEVLSRVCDIEVGKNELEDDYLKALIQSIEDKDYRRSYDALRAYVQHVFRDVDIILHRDIFKDAVTRLVGMIPGMDQSQKQYYLQKYKITARVISDEITCNCFLFPIISEVYRQLCVSKYYMMNKVLQYIEININNDISLSELSEHGEISNGYLSRIFKKCYNVSVVDYIHLRKITIAKEYMASGNFSISDISFMLGYSETGYFSKVFKKYEGIAPSIFINQYFLGN